MKVTQRYCDCCAAQRPFEKPSINHVLHLFLSVLTSGVWILVWIILASSAESKLSRCRSCGGEESRPDSNELAEADRAARVSLARKARSYFGRNEALRLCNEAIKAGRRSR